MDHRLPRNQFAYLFHRLFDKYRITLSEQGIDPPVKQEDILGYGNSKKITEKHDISQSNSSLSHVIYFDLTKRKYPFTRRGFKREFKEGDLPIQGGELQNAYQEYNRGYTDIYLSPNYLNVYLFYLEITRKELFQLGNENQNVPVELIIPFSTTKRRKGKHPKITSPGPEFDIIYDIYLAAPILTLGLKINENYRDFKATLEKLLGPEFSPEVENELIQHFFGFSTDDLQREFKQFEKSIEDLRKKLLGLELSVFDSREGVSVRHVSPVAQSQKRFIDDVEAIRSSRTYILISPYPRLFSSAWVEAGSAINMGKPCLFICSHRKTDLPFVLQERSGTLNFEVSDNWNIKRQLSDGELLSVAEGIKAWTSDK